MKTDYYNTLRGRSVRLNLAAKHRAKKKGVEYGLTAEWIEERIRTGTCPATGLEFDLTPGSARAPSIDRKVDSYGYVPFNCEVVVAVYNYAKGPWGQGAVEALALAWLRQRGINC